MAVEAQPPHAAAVQTRVDRLLALGYAALRSGDKRSAHDRWREAAETDPYNERVWVSLLNVLSERDDRRVCLENIVAINPYNADARRQLRRLQEDAHAHPSSAARTVSTDTPRSTWRSFGVGIGYGLIAGAVGIALGVVLSILIYA
jgi:hypothetical protein